MGTRARFLLLGATAILALHTFVDAFVAPQQGTRWTDELAPGLVPLALLGAAAIVFVRARPGARAAVAASLGVLALEGAGLAIADVSRGWRRGSDWTGFLLAPAGLVLLAVAVALLWRARRGGRLRHLRRALLGGAVVVGAYWLLLPTAMALYATHGPRAEVRPGYGVLLLDMRGYEGSDGSPNAFGWGAIRDLDAAVAWLARRPDVHGARIGGIGFSVGGEQLLEAAAENPRLRAVVSEGAGERSVRETLLRGPRGWPAVPAMAVETAALTVFSQTLPPPALDVVAARIAPRAAFFVYAEHASGGEELNPRFFAAARGPKALWQVPMRTTSVGSLRGRRSTSAASSASSTRTCFGRPELAAR